MEDRDVFTFRNRDILVWLAVVLLGSLGVTLAEPPAFWLFPIGLGFIIVAGLAHSYRTGQKYTWERWESRLNWFEGWAASTGGIVLVSPLLGLFFAS